MLSKNLESRKYLKYKIPYDLLSNSKHDQKYITNIKSKNYQKFKS